MKRTNTTTDSVRDELELTLDVLKDLTVTGHQADAVKGGVTSGAHGNACYCGTW